MSELAPLIYYIVSAACCCVPVVIFAEAQLEMWRENPPQWKRLLPWIK